MKSFHIPRTALFFILFALAAFAVLYRPIDLKALVRASSQGTLRTEEVAHFGSTNDMDYHLLSMDSEAFQQTAELLSTVSCRKKLNQPGKLVDAHVLAAGYAELGTQKPTKRLFIHVRKLFAGNLNLAIQSQAHLLLIHGDAPCVR